MAAKKPYSRGEYDRALIANALLDPFNLGVLAVVAIVGVAVGALEILGPVAAALYLAGFARTYFDPGAAERVLERGRARRGPALASAPPLDFGDEMERILVELDTIRGQIVSVGAVTGHAKGRELAGEVRALREQIGAVSDGMAAAYEDIPAP